jgi:hypothetical protein
VKSRARGFAEGEEVRVTLHATARDDGEARTLVGRALADVRESLREAGVRER